MDSPDQRDRPGEDPTPAAGRPPGLGARRVAMGLGAFLVLGALGAWAASRLDSAGELSFRGILSAVPIGVSASVLGLVCLDYLMGGLRLHVWVRRLAPRAGLSASVRTYLVNILAASISPMGSASGPAQIAVLHRHGVPPARAIAALLVNFVGLLAAFLLVGGASGLYLATGARLSEGMTTMVQALLLVAGGVGVLLLVVVGNPRLGGTVADRVAAIGRRRGWTWCERLGVALGRGVADYRDALATLRVAWYRPFTIATFLSAAMLLNKCLVGYLLAVGMGFDGSYVDVAARQSLQWLLIYFSPSPGGSGVAEASVPAFLAGIVPAGRILEYTVLWRLWTAFLGALIGGVVALRVFARSPRSLRER